MCHSVHQHSNNVKILLNLCHFKFITLLCIWSFSENCVDHEQHHQFPRRHSQTDRLCVGPQHPEIGTVEMSSPDVFARHFCHNAQKCFLTVPHRGEWDLSWIKVWMSASSSSNALLLYDCCLTEDFWGCTHGHWRCENGENRNYLFCWLARKSFVMSCPPVFSTQEGMPLQAGLLRHGMEKIVGMKELRRPQSELTMRWRHTGKPTTTRWAMTESLWKLILPCT